MFRDKQGCFDVSKHDQHKPTKGDTGVHIAQQGLTFPYLDVEQAVENDVLDVLEEGGRRYKRNQEFPSVHPRNVVDNSAETYGQVYQYENEASNKWHDKVAVSTWNPVDEFLVYESIKHRI